MADEAKVAPAKAQTTATNPTKPANLPDGYKKKTGALQRKKKVIPKYNDYDDDQDSSEPEFAFPHREGKHRIIAARQSRITDRPQDGKEPTMSIKIELDLEVEVEIYARVKGDVSIELV